MELLPELNFPKYNFSIIQNNNNALIFDKIRKKNIILTPEEWVRQHLIQFLINNLHCPISLIAIEKQLIINSLQKRFDVLVYNKQQTPQLLVECKAPNVKLSNKTFEQAAQYNLHLKAPYLIITNGLQHYCSKINFESKHIETLKELPHYLNW